MKKEKPIDSNLLNESINKAYNRSIPFITTIEITQSCNFRCLHCYNYDRTKAMPEKTKNESLKPFEIINLIDSLGAMGCMYLNLSGGEALLNPHLTDFVKRARSHKMEVRLKTNGALLNSKKLKALTDEGLKGVDVSLYGFSHEVYKEFVGKAESLDQSIEGIKLLANSNVITNINIILHRNNVHELDQMIKFCEGLNLSFQISTEVTERYDGSHGARDHEITSEQFEELLLGPYGHFFMASNKDKSVQCSCARSVCGVNSLGDVLPCIGAPIKSGNLREDTFENIWKSSAKLKEIRELSFSDFKECTTCDYIEYCDRSSGSCYVNTGSYTGCDNSLLSQAKIRKANAHNFK